MLITLSNGRQVPVEMHKIKIVQKINLLPAAQRLECLRAVGYNTFLLPVREVFLDMLTDSGTNAMSDKPIRWGISNTLPIAWPGSTATGTSSAGSVSSRSLR